MEYSRQNKLQLTVYKNDIEVRISWLQALRKVLRQLSNHKFFIWQKAKTNFLSPHKNSSMGGLFWAFVMPIVGPMVYVLLQIAGVFSSNTTLPRSLYVVAGFFIWNLWSESFLAAMNCLSKNGDFIKKNDIPILAVYLSEFGLVAFNILPIAVIFLVIAFVYGFNSFFLLYLFLVSLYCLGLGFGLGAFCSFFTVYSNDIKNILIISLRYLMFASAVIFPLPMGSAIGKIASYNPLYIVVENSRNLMLFGISTPFFLQ